MDDKKLTRSQQNALHLFYEQLAKEMNENGITLKQALAKFNLEVPATKHAVKEYLWRPLQEAITGKYSTTELLKQREIDQIYDSLNKFFAENLHLQIPPFPSMEIIDWEKEIKCKTCPCDSPNKPNEWVGKVPCDCYCHLKKQ